MTPPVESSTPQSVPPDSADDAGPAGASPDAPKSGRHNPVSRPLLSRIGIVALEAVGIIVALIVVLGGYAVWQAEHSSLGLNPFRDVVADRLDRELPPAYDLSLGDINMHSVEGKNGLYRITIRDWVLVGEAGDVEITAPVVTIDIAKKSLFARAPRIKQIIIPEMMVTAQRGEARSLEPAEPPIQSSDVVDSQQVLASINKALMAFHHGMAGMVSAGAIPDIRLDALKISFMDGQTGQNWHTDEARLEIVSTEQDIRLDLEAIVVAGQASAILSVHGHRDFIDNRIMLRANGNAIPVGDIISIATGRAPIFTSHVSGFVDLTSNPDDGMESSNFNLTIGPGRLAVADSVIEIKEITAQGHIDPLSQTVAVQHLTYDLGQNKGTVTGQVALTSQSGSVPNAHSGDFATGTDVDTPPVPPVPPGLAFQLSGEETHLYSPGFFPASVLIDRYAMQGSLDLDKNHLVLDTLELTTSADTDNVGVVGGLTLMAPPTTSEQNIPPQTSIGFIANLKTVGSISHASLMKLWPLTLAPRSRRWVAEQIHQGVASNLIFTMNMPVGMRAEVGYMPDHALKLTFDVRNVTAEYIPGMTPARKASGKGLLTGNSLILDIDSAELKSIRLKKGKVSFPQFRPVNAGTFFDLQGGGEARDILSVLDEEPLGLISGSGLSPQQVSGTVVADIKIGQVPSGDDTRNITYDGVAQFTDITLLDAFSDLDLNQGKGTLELKTDGMRIKADAFLGLTPVVINWNQQFFVQNSPSRLTVSGEIDSAIADLLGVPSRSFFTGSAPFNLQAVGSFRQFETIDFTTDLSLAELRFTPLNWIKPAGRSANATLSMSFDQLGQQASSFKMTGDGIEVDGRYELDSIGRLTALDIPTLALSGLADMSVNAQRENNTTLKVNAQGDYLNLAPLIDSYFEIQDQRRLEARDGDIGQVDADADDDWGNGIRAALRFDKLALRNDILMSDAIFDVWHNGDKLNVFSLSARDENDRPLSIALTEEARVSSEVEGQPADNIPADNEFIASGTGDDSPAMWIMPVRRIIEAKAEDLGILFQGIFDVASIRGGTGTMQIILDEPRKGDLTGTINAQAISIVNAPLLAKLFAAGSLDGLADLMGNEGIVIERAFADFALADGKIQIDEANAIGPSVGLSAIGVIGLDGGEVELSGSLAPLYQLNSFLGKAPLIGELLVSRKGEGILALAYEISGTVVTPSVTIKPLSALAPGVFRRAFDPVRDAEQNDTQNDKKNNKDQEN